MITFHFFTYRADAALVPFAVQSTRIAADNAGWRHGTDYRLIVIDDATQPCPPATRAECAEHGAEWRESSYCRGGNLRGQECIVGMLRDMQASCPGDQDIAVKIDSDMIICNLDWLVEFVDLHDIPAASDTTSTYDMQLAGGDDRGSVYGMLYALRGMTINNLLSMMTILPVGPLAPEDQTIGYRTRLVYTDKLFYPLPLRVPVRLPHSCNGPDGIIAVYRWDLPGNEPGQYLDCAAVNLRATLIPVPEEDVIAVSRQLMPAPYHV